MFILLVALAAVASAQTFGCADIGNGPCFVQVTADLTGFGPDLSVAITAPSPSIGGSATSYNRQGGQERTYRFQVPPGPQVVTIELSEGQTRWSTNLNINPNDQSTYQRTLTGHRATLSVNLQNYNPANNNPTPGVFNPNVLPSFEGNLWGVKLFTFRNGQRNVFREYRPSSLVDQCSFTNVIPLSEFGNLAAMPWSAATQVVVLPDTDINVRIIENFSDVCQTLPAVYVDCHLVNSNAIGVLYNSDCTSGSCNSGLCVTNSIIDNRCNWNAIPSNPPVVRRGIQDNVLMNVSIHVGPSENVIFERMARYRDIPRLPFGFRYEPYILATGFYQAEVSYTSDDPTPARVRTLATSCTDATSCDFKPITSIARLDIGQNTAAVTLRQDNQVIGQASEAISGVGYFCVLNLELNANVVYDGSATISRTDPDCADADQYCDLGPFYVWVEPSWDCWADSEGLDTPDSYPSAGLQFFVYRGGSTSNRVWPPANVNPLPFITVPLASQYLAFQVPDVADTLTLRVQEGACGTGQGANLAGCPFVDFNLQSTGQGQNRTTDEIGRILSAFELFYLPEDNSVTVNLLTSPAMDVFRITEDQGGRPRCYCVLPIVLMARLTENNAACWKSDNVSCVERVRPNDDDDCELCDFLSILRVDLRGLPRMTTNGRLRVSERDGVSTPFYEQNFELGASYANWNPNPPRTVAVPASGSDPATIALRVLQQENPLRNGASFTVTVPSTAVEVVLSYRAQATAASAEGDVVITGSQSGVVLSQGQSPIQLQVGVWTSNTITLPLVVVPGETLTVLFRATNDGASVSNTPLIDDIVLSARQFNIVDVRPLLQIGGANNNITVLRSCQCDTPQRYWVEVTDNTQAVKELSTECCSKECLPFPDGFTKQLCLDLADCAPSQNTPCIAGRHPYPLGVRVYGLDPNRPVEEQIQYGDNWFNPTVGKDSWQSTEYDGCGYTIRERVTTEIWIPGASGPFRTRARQGGYDGCAVQATCSMYGGCPAQGYSGGSGSSRKRMTEYIMGHGRNAYNTWWNGNSWYTVLQLEYVVRLVEYSAAKLTNVDCRVAGECRNTEPLVSCLLVDTECEGTPDSRLPQTHSGDLMQLFIVANSSDPDEILRYNPTKGTYPGIGFDIVLTNAQGEQFRGKRSKLFLPNCTFDRWTWSSATCLDCGYRQNYFTVLAVELGVRITEVPYADRSYQYPDPRVLPTKLVQVSCTAGGACAPTMGSLFSRLWVQSLRGPPSNFANGIFPFMVVKFGDVVQTSLRLIHESWLYTDTKYNPVCVIADERSEYSIDWADWASNTAGLEFADCSSLSDNTIDNCRNPGSANVFGAIVVPQDTGNKRKGGEAAAAKLSAEHEQLLERIKDTQQA